jgi:gas vesicle protein
MSDNGPRPDGKFLIGLVIGGIVGAGAVYLLATKEGKKVRKEVEEKGKELVDDLHEKIEDFEVSGKELLKKGEEIKEQVVEQLEDKKEALTKETTERLDSALAHIEAIQEHGRQTTANIRKKLLFKNIPKKG